MNVENSIRIFLASSFWRHVSLVFLGLNAFCSHTFAQSTFTWEKTLGGDGWEELQQMVETPDGHFLFVGNHTSSMSGDIGQASRGLTDYWIVKVDINDGAVLWEHSYGGNLIDNCRSIAATSDGGYILGGYSSSGVNGDKTEPTSGACWNCFDYWMVKVDADGLMEWDRTINADDWDEGNAILQTLDGGYLIGGFSNSSMAEDKSENSIGDMDYWIIRTDAAGNTIWDQTYGGTASDFLQDMIALPDSGFVLAGSSSSNMGGDHTADSNGGQDYWVIRIDSLGNTIWEFKYGGDQDEALQDIHPTRDGGFLLMGSSFSGISGNKSEANIGERDYWIVKIDPDGNLLWDRTYGADDRDEGFGIDQSINGNYLISGLSRSGANGDKSRANIGGSDYWLITLDEAGNLLKEIAFGAEQNDNLYQTLPMSDGSLILGGITASDISGDKTEASRGFNDAWMVRLDCTLDFDIGNDTTICLGETVSIDATHHPCVCCEYEWNDGDANPIKTFTPTQDTVIHLTISDGYNCYLRDSLVISVLPIPSVDLGNNTSLCDGDTLSLDAGNTGSNFTWFPSGNTQTLEVTNSGLYGVSVTDANNCSNEDAIMVEVLASPVQMFPELICAGDSLFLENAWRKASGMFFDTLNTYQNCDSVVITDLFVAPLDTTYLNFIACDQSQAGVSENLLNNQFGCDSLIITTTIFIDADTTFLFANSCDPNQAGVSENLLNNQLGCDSLIITTTNFIDADTTYLFANSCDPNQAGVSENLLNNQFGCDSLIITTTNFIDADTTYLFANSCDPNLAGISENLLNNQLGCDSLIITTTNFMEADTTYLNATSCDPNQAGTMETLLANQLGCDSLIITTTSFAEADTTNLEAFNCDMNQSGVSEQLFFNVLGCDSLVVTTTLFIDADTTYQDAISCDANQAGVVESLLSNQFGCDSLIITTTAFVAADTTFLNASSCDANQAGIVENLLSNQLGCDSLIITTTNFVEADTTYLNANSCDANQAGVVENLLNNQLGCDSLIITTTTFVEADTTYFFLNSCDANQAGIVENLLSNQLGCDSLIITTTAFVEADTTFLSANSCDMNQAGTVENLLNNQLGCDSLIVTTTTFVEADTTYFNVTSCDPNQSGTSELLLFNQLGCDSLIVTTTTFAEADTTYLDAYTCDANQAGSSTTLFINQLGCDSLVISSTEFVAADTSYLTAFSCDPNQAGQSSQLMINQFGCDSLIISDVFYLPPDTTYAQATSCDPAQAGTTTEIFTNQAGCDSLIITATTFAEADTTYFNDITCDPMSAGQSSVLYSNQLGCDSLVISTLALVLSDTTFIQNFTCDQNQSGQFISNLMNQYNCDSTIVLNTIFIPSDTTFLAEQTCDPSLAGIQVTNLSNAFNCDSVIITNTTLVASDTTFLSAQTCEVSQAGTITSELQNQYGCDSTVVETIVLVASDTTFLTDQTCLPANVGILITEQTNQYGCDSIVLLNTTLLPNDITYFEMETCNVSLLGSDSITMTNQYGCDSLIVTTYALPTVETAISTQAVGCFDDRDGIIFIDTVIGGTAPYLYALDDGPFQGFEQFFQLSAGTYRVMVQDADGCEYENEVVIESPSPFQVNLGQDTTVEVGTLLTLDVQSNQIIDSLVWTPQIDCEVNDCLAPVIQPLETTLYELLALDANGCQTQSSVQVFVAKERPVYFPSAFSPNGDGVNDFYRPHFGFNSQVIHQFKIFNRWGALVYQAENINAANFPDGWDGRLNNQYVNSGVFLYYAEIEFVDGSRKEFSGDLTVLR